MFAAAARKLAARLAGCELTWECGAAGDDSGLISRATVSRFEMTQAA